MGDNIEWSSDQMINNASNWSLAGDVAILNSLKKFSQYVLSETEELNHKVDSLLNNLEHVGLKLQLTRNEFHSLRNTQFIENRVYEDDETVENPVVTKNVTQPTEEDKELSLKKAIANGLNVMEKYFDKVELSISDSEGEDNDQSYVLKLKDPYIDRPLPYLIGTEDWQKKWHVGLLPSDNESDSEKEQDVYSSDSDTTLPKNVVIGSETSSEFDFTNRNTGGPVANSTFNNSKDSRQDMFKSSDDDSSAPPVRAPTSTENFAEQLAAKLGDVITGQNNKTQNFGNLFSDQPPPIGDLDETILPKPANEGLFSPGRNLFSENVAKAPKVESTSKTTRGLFDSDSSSEEDVLAITERRKLQSSGKPPNPYLQPPKTSLPFLDEQPPEEPPKKKPVGGVSLFGDNPNIFQPKIPQPKKPLSLFDNSSEDEEIFSPKKPEKQETTKKVNLLFDESEEETDVKPKPTTKKISLFDDDDDFLKEEEDLFASVNKKKPPKNPILKEEKVSLFDDLESDSLVTSEAMKPKEEKLTKSLFDDLESSNSAEEDLFSENKPTPKEKPSVIVEKSFFDEPESTNQEKLPVKVEQGITSSLFDDSEDSNSVNGDLFTIKTTKKEENTDQQNKDSVKSSTKVIKNLFDDLEDSNSVKDDIFTIKTTKKEESTDQQTKDNVKSSTKDTESLFDDPEGTNQEKLPLKVEQGITSSLFDDLEDPNSVKDDIFTIKTTKKEANTDQQTKSNVKSSTKDTESLFDDLEDSNSVKDDIFTIKITKKEENTEQQNKDIVKSRKKEMESLFDDSDTEKSDLFDKPAENITKDDFPFYKNVAEPSKKSVSFDDNALHFGGGGTAKMDEDSGKNGKKEEKVESPPINIPAINVFDPTPPPVDWDALSDNSADSDNLSLTDGILERTSYQQSQNTVSSLFDEAPPSLDMNYSSGIVKDANATRMETDDSSSFYPYASSTRRLSSDIFADEQSQDSFFVTKNRTDSIAPASILEQITENSEGESKIEYLTTSGLEEDFEGSSSSVFPQENVGKSDKDIMAPPPVLQRVAFLTEETGLEKPKPAAKTSPGKLKHNLNINVGALLPGAAPVKPKILVDKSSLDETDDIPKLVVRRPSRAGPAVRPKSESESFVGVGDTEVLQSVTKDRVKIPVKRRPSTRRARQEAVRKSMTDFTLYKGPEEEPDKEIIEDNKPATIKSLETKQSNIFEDNLFDSGGSEDEDLFPKDLKVVEKKMEETKPVQTAQITKTSLFADKSDSDSDDGLFAPTQKSKINPPAKSSLFDDSDSSEDDLFGTKTSVPSSSSGKRKQIVKTANVKKLENKPVTDFDPLSGFK